ncbi:MAG TPA: nucleoside triphosphate pyrophosphatase [Natronosporangium sp.]
MTNVEGTDGWERRPVTQPRLVLASASPARRRVLAAAGIDAQVVLSGVDESIVDAARPDTLCAVLARLKARAVAEKLRHGSGPVDGVLVLGCDSVLGFEGEALGKPGDAAEAVARWRRMRGREGVLYTGHTLVDLGTARTAEAVADTRVFFADVSDEEVDAYVATGEPLEVAGAFTIDGFGSPFVERIDGDPGTVLGLSLPLLRRLLAELDIPITALWRRSSSALPPTI